jgi:predicted short-subunit dehydrogenase-like oxidoreductase (DUF2520 family)
MNNQPSRLGLVAEGNTGSSSVLRILKLSEELGPVKSAGLSAARRLANSLKAGYAVSRYEQLREAALVLLRVPDSSLNSVIQEIAATDLEFAAMSFVLCESWLPLEVLNPLKNLGSQTGTLMTLPLSRRDWFVLDGDNRTVRSLRRLIEGCGCRATELLPHGKHFLFAAELLATAIPLASFQAAQRSLRASGFSGNLLTLALEQMLQKTVKDFLHGSKPKWGGPLRECSEETGRHYLRELAGSRPDLAAFIEEQVASVQRLQHVAE